MDYFKYQVNTNPDNNEVLIALMSLQPFDSFVESDAGFDAFVPAAEDSPEIDAYLDDLKTRFDFDYEKEFIKGENWNEVWESNFNPIKVEHFCGLRAEFHPPMEGVEHELVITPKMAFGTGHHETTYMMIRLMKDLDFSGKQVFDYGCGTGVLAILASRLGAKEIDAVDIEEASFQNTLENCETNNVHNVHAQKGDISAVKGKRYGIVLANINRNVILDSLEPLSHIVGTGGTVVFSGFVLADETMMRDAVGAQGFSVAKVLARNNWMAMQCVKN